MMVKNQTDHPVYAGGTVVPPDGEFHQVKDDPGARELLKSGTLTEQKQRSGGSAKSNEGGDDS